MGWLDGQSHCTRTNCFSNRAGSGFAAHVDDLVLERLQQVDRGVARRVLAAAGNELGLYIATEAVAGGQAFAAGT